VLRNDGAALMFRAFNLSADRQLTVLAGVEVEIFSWSSQIAKRQFGFMEVPTTQLESNPCAVVCLTAYKSVTFETLRDRGARLAFGSLREGNVRIHLFLDQGGTSSSGKAADVSQQA
jgi:hypothetical protein